MSSIDFTPDSIESFKRAARDLHKCFGNPLQECQEALAKAYGYQDLHALQSHLKSKPTPGPYADDLDDPFARLTLRTNVVNRLRGHLKPIRRERLDFDDLGLCERPQSRGGIMAFQRAVDELLDGRVKPNDDLVTSDYLWFEDDDEQKEGILRRTELSEQINTALVHLAEVEMWADRTPNADEAESLYKQVHANRLRIYAAHPASPYAFAAILASVFNEYEDGLPRPLAKELWDDLQRCRSMFETVVPRGYRRHIEPKLAGNGADNHPYIAVLYAGACCAMQIGRQRDALRWARKGKSLDKHDSFGFRYLIQALE